MRLSGREGRTEPWALPSSCGVGEQLPRVPGSALPDLPLAAPVRLAEVVHCRL